MADNSDAWDESQRWVTEADRHDGQLAPSAELVFERSSLAAGETVLDVGCGCGAMTIKAARVCAAAVGVDVSAAVLAVARQRATDAQVANVEFVEADAQRHRFGSGQFDAVISRFGLMFFDDPLVAFTNRVTRFATKAGWCRCAGKDWRRTRGCSCPDSRPPLTCRCRRWSGRRVPGCPPSLTTIG